MATPEPGAGGPAADAAPRAAGWRYGSAPTARLLDDVAEAVGLAVFAVDVASGAAEVSDAFYRMIGLDPVADGGARLFDRVHPDDAAMVEAAVEAAVVDGRPYAHELRFYDATGGTRVLLVNASVRLDEAGAPARLLGTIQDVTALRQAAPVRGVREAESQRLLETRLEEALAIAKMGRWEFDVARNAVAWSDELVRLLGATPAELGGDAGALRAIVHPDDLPMVERVGTAAFMSPEPFSYEFRLKGVPGEGRVLLLRGQTVFGPDGRPVRQFGTIQDVTEARQAEEALRRSLAVLAVQQDASPDGILLVDEHAHVISSNRRFRELWRLPAALVAAGEDRPLLHRVVDQVADPEGFMARVQHLYDHPGEVAEEEVPLADGRVFERYSAPAVAPDGTYYGRLWIFRDITERKRLEAALQAQNEQLRELDRLKVTFINAVSHELRVPLTSVLGYTEFIEEMLGEEAPGAAAIAQAREYLATAQVNARRLQVLVDDLLDFALLEAGMFQLRKEPGDFAQRVRETAVALRPQAARQAQAIELALPEAPVPLAMDGQRIGQVISNLVINALKFTPPETAVVVRVTAGPAHVRCEVADAGGGIAPEDLPRLFQRYGQLEAGKRRGGSGLGLYISKALVEAHGGSIGVDSVPGVGSTFWFELPR